jgi:hypothetical protein
VNFHEEGGTVSLGDAHAVSHHLMGLVRQSLVVLASTVKLTAIQCI